MDVDFFSTDVINNMINDITKNHELNLRNKNNHTALGMNLEKTRRKNKLKETKKMNNKLT